MKFYFDESGSFRIPTAGEHCVGIVVGVTIPETAEAEVFAKYDDFIATLSSSAFKSPRSGIDKEPRGYLLSLEERQRFCQMISELEPVLIDPVILDITSLAKSGRDVKIGLVKKLEWYASQCVHQTMRDETLLLSRQFNRLSDNQALRLFALAQCIRRTFQSTLLFRSGDEYLNCWDSLRFEIDPVQVKPGSREEQVFKWTILGWLAAWSVKEPITTVEEIHTQDHPFVKNFETKNGIDLGKVLKENIHYVSSARSKGVQIADMAASVVSYATNGIVQFANLESYGLLMNRNVYAPEHAVGLFSVVEENMIDINRYEGLTQAIDFSRRRRRALGVEKR